MIKLFVMDVDGTLTDGGIYYDDEGREFKKFNVKDGAGIKLLQKNGITTMILTGRKSACVEKRGKELGIPYIVQGCDNKKSYLQSFMDENSIKAEETAYIGDDINDLSCMSLVAHCGCPNDAVEEVIQQVEYICDKKGGEGAVREFAEYILRLNE